MNANWMRVATAAVFAAMISLAAEAAPPAPDYAQVGAWAALPDMQDGADSVPEGSGAVDRQATAKVDVFFIHPTSFVGFFQSNAAYDESGGTKEKIDVGMMRYQASAFNGCCRVYAPRYRQASLMLLVRDSTGQGPALDVAYGDVLNAFEYFLEHYNKGRPFIIASHSQGSILGMRLLQERIAGTPLQKRMVAAYLVGSLLPADIEKKGIPICATPEETGCAINWNSVARGASDERRRETAAIWLDGKWQHIGGRRVVCVNPLNWLKDGDAPASSNLGAEPGGNKTGPLAPVVTHLTGATCDDSRLFVDIPEDAKAFTKAALPGGIYHVIDYGLFYMNIRQNAEARVAAYLAKPH